ncbi:pentapeptide repeat-containing protein [Euhalothece natronophila Z-M001]|uniref:Pentapeptide repeat-containing protein n=1 Tax=Euhalothece natronophila Z-M001 TaxID=522448 RepID=A0A5B8NNF0_9CHRO|nr:pentapeptide repeat-containing protein [Euhalothece natronophila]QDZ40517.1 pentapeptide repeat-containing protein [Euhalothece natronophila Z-M001]
MRQVLKVSIVLGAIALFFLSSPVLAATPRAVRSFNEAVEAETKDFSEQELIEAEFYDEELEGADFHNANLQGAVFNGATLHNANWQGVNFSNGIAYLTDFTGTDLTNAVLTEAMMLRSKFDNAKIEGADFTDAVVDRLQMTKLCERASGVNPTTGVSTRESLGCR